MLASGSHLAGLARASASTDAYGTHWRQLADRLAHKQDRWSHNSTHRLHALVARICRCWTSSISWRRSAGSHVRLRSVTRRSGNDGRQSFESSRNASRLPSGARRSNAGRRCGRPRRWSGGGSRPRTGYGRRWSGASSPTSARAVSSHSGVSRRHDACESSVSAEQRRRKRVTVESSSQSRAASPSTCASSRRSRSSTCSLPPHASSESRTRRPSFVCLACLTSEAGSRVHGNAPPLRSLRPSVRHEDRQTAVLVRHSPHVPSPHHQHLPHPPPLASGRPSLAYAWATSIRTPRT